MTFSKFRVFITILLSIFASALIFSSLGCTETPAQDPEQTVVKFFDYLYQGDFGSAQRLCTSRALDQTDGGENAFSKIRDDHSSGTNDYTENKLVTDIRGNTAEVYSREDENLRILLVKSDSGWKIDEFQWRTPQRETPRARDDQQDEEVDEDDNDNAVNNRRQRDEDEDG